jgi:hypothetical protein
MAFNANGGAFSPTLKNPAASKSCAVSTVKTMGAMITATRFIRPPYKMQCPMRNVEFEGKSIIPNSALTISELSYHAVFFWSNGAGER